MDSRDYERMLKKYRDPRQRFKYSLDVLGDLEQLLQHVEALTRLTGALRMEAKGGLKTMLAITKAVGGIVEVPYALIELLDAGDKLHVADVQRGDSIFKQFSYVSKEDALKRDRERSLLSQPDSPSIH